MKISYSRQPTMHPGRPEDTYTCCFEIGPDLMRGDHAREDPSPCPALFNSDFTAEVVSIADKPAGVGTDMEFSVSVSDVADVAIS